jgi:hypothetical protein
MTRKDFELIAEAIRTFPISAERKSDLAHHFSYYLMQTNDRFDPDLFHAAATRSSDFADFYSDPTRTEFGD